MSDRFPARSDGEANRTRLEGVRRTIRVAHRFPLRNRACLWNDGFYAVSLRSNPPFAPEQRVSWVITCYEFGPANFVPVPESSVFALVAAGGLVALVVRRRGPFFKSEIRFGVSDDERPPRQ